MTNHLAPQEDDMRLPAAWARFVLPRRGRDTPDVKLDPGALDAYRERLRRTAPQLQETLRLPANRDWHDDAQAYLLGEPNPRGAATVAALAGSDEADSDTALLRPALDVWMLEFGLPFATAAAVERLTRVVDRTIARGERRLLGGIDAYPHLLMKGLGHGCRVLRGLLADASDEEYAAAVAAVAPLRDDPARRMAAALLLPDETAWTEEASADYEQHQDWGWTDVLFWNWVRTPEQLAAAKLTRINEYLITVESIAALTDGLGPAALPVLTATLDGGKRPNAADRRLLLTAIAALPSDEAMTYLIGRLHEPDVFGAAATAVGHFPVRALRHLARVAGATPVERRPRLAALAAAIAADARDHLTETERAALDTLVTATSAVPAAALGDLPPLLASPPWTGRRPKRQAVVLEGLEAPSETVLVWAPGEQERWANLHHLDYSGYDDRRWAAIAGRPHPSHDSWVTELVAFAPPELAARFKDRWNGKMSTYQGEAMLRRIIGRFGAEAADRAVAAVARHHQFTAALLPIRGVAAARLAAERLGLKSARPQAAAWFDRHGVDAAALLVPDALGTDPARRRAAETALAHLARTVGPDAVRDAARPYGPEAFEAVSALMDADPLEPVGARIPKPGPWANAAMLPQVLLAGRERAVPAAAVPHLVTVLALGAPEFPYAGVDVVAEACDRESLRRFSWALFEEWIAIGAPSKDGWALTQLAHVADDVTVSRLAALIREWPGQGQHKRAVTGLRVLGAIGSEAALRAIHAIAQKAKFKALKEEAGRQIEAVAEGLGLSTEQLADRLVPDFGLDDASSMVLDYGPRRFRVGFDEALKPFVTDMDGKPRKSLPKPGAKDDALLAQAARERFAFLKKELRTVAADLVGRLESAMIQGRTWTAEEFRRHFTDHPLVRHLARRLVWTAEADGERIAFRLAEDGTLSDADDDAFTLPDEATVRLAHPILLGDQAGRWAEILADYEILQPFEQLGRPMYAFEAADLATGRLTRFESTVVETGRILGMTKRGWERAAPADAGMEPGIAYRIADDAYLLVELDPGLYAAAYESATEQTMRQVRLAATANFWSGDAGPDVLARFADLDPLRASEALASLHRLAGKE
ncbi:DUF4132 domain-containing protein [Glycomyces sp. TRM65418]|uniref:DUF4132 domain-containing protein n=1 Tax=Glycomyces sp. TRM65418 TaxID=2867006 RepID=UPI001CE50195|nr:DUF4132 domain-containing protein [Glycomyces sp. TRM65418]MCC3764337.1 DUF4132 domain-containing protein [Glycomyces sp. TRM65418]QZD54016.1 DUF4132 domain-containing protein [Glycomyces sp. TRM65418]